LLHTVATKREKEEQVKSWKIVTLSIVLVGIIAPVLAQFTTWFGPTVREGLMTMAPPAAAALALVLYFNWRSRLKDRILGDAGDDDLARAA
jgi:hypothetical protein